MYIELCYELFNEHCFHLQLVALHPELTLLLECSLVPTVPPTLFGKMRERVLLALIQESHVDLKEPFLKMAASV